MEHRHFVQHGKSPQQQELWQEAVDQLLSLLYKTTEALDFSVRRDDTIPQWILERRNSSIQYLSDLGYVKPDGTLRGN